MKHIKENYKFVILLMVVILSLIIKFPYYIDAPGGITDISKKIEIDGYKSKGSFNLAYVKEYRATIPTLLISLFNKDWNVIKIDDVLLNNETDKDYLIRDKLLMKEGISNAIYVAYTRSNKKINIISNSVNIAYIFDKANTNLTIGDEILSVNDINIYSKDDIKNILYNLNVGDKLKIQVKNNSKIEEKYAYVIEEDNTKIIGVIIANIRKYNTTPLVSIEIDENESGSSGGLITALAIYNSLISEDITKGYTIVGTGTIDSEGNVGDIGGVKYKLKSSEKAKADIFLVPNGDNCNDAIKLKKENNYKIDVKCVSTFDETIEYLRSYD